MYQSAPGETCGLCVPRPLLPSWTQCAGCDPSRPDIWSCLRYSRDQSGLAFGNFVRTSSGASRRTQVRGPHGPIQRAVLAGRWADRTPCWEVLTRVSLALFKGLWWTRKDRLGQVNSIHKHTHVSNFFLIRIMFLCVFWPQCIKKVEQYLGNNKQWVICEWATLWNTLQLHKQTCL